MSSSGSGKKRKKEEDRGERSLLTPIIAQSKKLRGLSGFGWDEGLKIVTASDDVWAAYLEKHENAKKWRKKPFPLYDDIMFLVDDKVATGAGAFHAGASQTPSDIFSQSQGSTSTQDDNDDSSFILDGMGDTSTDLRLAMLVNMDLDNDFVASSPATAPSTSRKRAASSSPNKSAPSRRAKRNAEAISEIAGALRQVAMSLNAPSSPDITKRAIEMMEEDEFSEGEEPLVMRLFTKEIDIARTYVNTTKKSRRTASIRSYLAEMEL
ncbi:hypothetical protein B0H16DRAFT_1731442 [Mycena metata]|uniref:Myb/SANT-like domain-containing protein n=1 Tax=Mycena metata TaxID=1033252 RepID=A0AAD7I546_9AGAR|nr:hypothetical protein B0H16DRAFT_1731442 [Mycena metata]